MKWFLQWLKWRFAGEEMAALERYRVNIETMDRWFASHDDVVEILRWLRQCSEPKLRPGEVFIGVSISGLRAMVEAMRVERVNQSHIRCVRPGHPSACDDDPKVGCCYWRDTPEFP